MLKNKKGVELSLNMMILTVLAIIVLIVMTFFLMKGSSTTIDSTACTTHNGNCVTRTGTCPESKPVISPYSCGKEEKCCVNIGGLGDEAQPATK
jgi:hypothetical protein